MYPCMKLRHLEERLQSLSEFKHPKILLEQYITPAHLLAPILHTIQSQYGDISGKLVADLGCGCGAISVGCGVMDAGFVLGVEVDQNALDVFRENVEDHVTSNVDALQGDVFKNFIQGDRFEGFFDTVIMNPPFGTKHNAGMDMRFLEVGLRISNNVVYSLHKTSTRAHVVKTAQSLGARAEVLAQLHYDLPSTYKFHKKKSVDIEVDFFRFIKS